MMEGTRVAVPEDLDSVTTAGIEQAGGIAVDEIWRSVQDWYRTGLHPAIQVCLRVDGAVVLDRAIGHGWGNAPDDRADTDRVLATPDTPFCAYSAAKGITTVVLHLLAERGVLSLDDRVSDHIPGYERNGKGATTVRHVLTHSAGVPFPQARVGRLDDIDDPAVAVDGLVRMKPLHRPGAFHIYHALTFGFLTREIVRGATGKSIREILAAEILDPLGFRWTNYGVVPEDVAAVAPAHVTGIRSRQIGQVAKLVLGADFEKTIAISNDPRFLTGVVPSSNTVSTARELSRFYELLRRGGELDGVRVIRPETVRQARVQSMRLRPELVNMGRPVRMGQGFMLGSSRFGMFGRGTPQAFGHPGLVEVLGWADPQRGLAAAIISSGKPFIQTGSKFPAVLDRIAATVPRSA
ncbi:serine hydrolase [Skermania piniformis]